MIEKTKKYGILMLAFLWLVMWLLPWNVWLGSTPWVRLALALTLFVTPGMTLSMLLLERNFSLLGHILTGLAISIFIIGVFGLLGRIINFPFSYIKFLFASIGFVLLLFLFRNYNARREIFAPMRFSAFTVISLLLVFVLSVVNSLSQRFGGDDFHYLVYLTSWQHADPLSFQSVYTGLGGLDKVRYWINMFPMNLAFLAETSGLHGLLLNGLYLEPFLVVISLAASFILYEQLLGSERQAVIALLMQFTFLLLFQQNFQFGSAFFNRLSEDKGFAAFILSPLFFYAMIHWGRSFTLRGSILLLLVGWALALTHPIILAYTVFIGGVYLFLVTVTKKESKRFLLAMAVLLAIILPPATLRVVEVPWISRYIFRLETPVKQPGAFDLEKAMASTDVEDTRISVIEGTPFYGFNFKIIKFRVKDTDPTTIFSWFYVYILIDGFALSFFILKKRKYTPFIMASSLLILVTGIPYTGWLMGYLVTLRMLWRAPWVISIGLILFVLLSELYELIELRILKSSLKEWKPLSMLRQAGVILCWITILYFSSVSNYVRWNALLGVEAYHADLHRLVELGDYLEYNLEQPSRFAGPRLYMDYLPGLSSKSKVFYFASGGVVAGADASTRNQINPLLKSDDSISLNRRMGIMIKNRLEYILTEDDLVGAYYKQFPSYFTVNEINDFWIIEFHPVIP